MVFFLGSHYPVTKALKNNNKKKPMKYYEINNMFEALVNSEHFIVYGWVNILLANYSLALLFCFLHLILIFVQNELL